MKILNKKKSISYLVVCLDTLKASNYIIIILAKIGFNSTSECRNMIPFYCLFILLSILILLLILIIIKMHIIQAYVSYISVYINGIRDNIRDQSNKHSTEYERKSGTIAIVTGGARGIGTEVVKAFLKLDMTVIIGCRNIIAGQKFIETLRDSGVSEGKAECFLLDISSLSSVKKFAQIMESKYTYINILINNAALFYSPFILTEDGLECIFSTNFLGHALLTHHLLPSLIKGAQISNMNSRIINITSNSYQVGSINYDDINLTKKFHYLSAYAQSKLGIILFSKSLNNKLKTQSIPVQIHSIHPGIVKSNIFDNIPGSSCLPKLFFKNLESGARSIIYASFEKSLEREGGNYIVNCEVRPSFGKSNIKEEQENFWKLTLKLLNIETFILL